MRQDCFTSKVMWASTKSWNISDLLFNVASSLRWLHFRQGTKVCEGRELQALREVGAIQIKVFFMYF